MIQSHTLDEIPRGDPREHLRQRRGGRARLPEHRRAMWIGGGSISIPGDPLGAAGGFNGNLASLLPGAYQSVQSDLGLTYGGALAPVAGNTSTATMVRSGALVGPPIPIWLRGLGGGTADIYYDGLGVTPAMPGVTWATGTPINLTGAGSGLVITPSGGTLVGGDTWKATCSGLADQSGNAKHYTQGTAGSQPIVTIGLNGKAGLLFDGVNDFLTSTAGSLFTTSYLILVVGRVTGTAPAANAIVAGGVASTAYSGVIYETGAGQFSTYAGTVGPTVAFGATTNQRWAAKFTASAADSLKIGALTTTGPNSGAGVGPTRNIGSTADPGQYAKAEVFAVAYVPVATDYSAFDAAINSAALYGPGAIAV